MPDPVPAPEVKHLWAELETDGPQVGILMGSESDKEVMQAAEDELLDRAITFEMKVLSAHRDPVASPSTPRPRRFAACASSSRGRQGRRPPGRDRGLHGLPVIGVPMKTSDLGGMDSLLSIVQMPSGVPVACMAINGARNAAIYAAKILAQGQAPPPSDDI